MKIRALTSWISLAIFLAVASACSHESGTDVDGGDGSPDMIMLLPANAGCGLRDCTSAGASCGPVGDGCGALIDCGSCASGETCGGGGKLGQCGSMVICTPATCASLGFDCGPAGDGCGGALDCGTCSSGLACGVSGKPSVCGGVMCTPTTCAALGFNCGLTSDGCGALLDCSAGSACPSGQSCGGGGMSNKCGTSTVTPVPCTTNLCLKQKVCANPAVTTTLTGTVLAATDKAAGYGDPDPIYGATVYIPNAAVADFTAGVTCQQCASALSGSPVVSTTTGVDGKFTLTNVPVGMNIPLVIQVGRWRRKIVIPNVPECVTTALTAAQTRLPRDHNEGDIPLIAVVTGSADPLECILPKLGIAPSEFTNSTGTGRVRFYRSNGYRIDNNTKSAATLFDDLNELKKYDLVISDCEGSEIIKSATQKANVIAYTSAGGRMYATHFQYSWLFDVAPFKTTATFNVNQNDPPDLTANVDQTFAKGIAFAQWLVKVAASTTLGKIPVKQVRHNFDAVIPPSQRWLYADPAAEPNTPLHYTFNTPVGVTANAQCGRVMYSDFHVHVKPQGGGGGGGGGGGNTPTFPTACGAAAALTPQEKVLEFMLFDLTSCITPDNNSCTPKTCTQLGLNCGMAGDGCGGAISCGVCPSGQTCGGGGMANVCGGSCTATTCAAQNLNCGPAGDGCGAALGCGVCVAPATCGGGGIAGQCGNGCTPTTCAAQSATCGLVGDGCGGSIDCGPCTSPDTCGGGGVANQCGNVANPPIL